VVAGAAQGNGSRSGIAAQHAENQQAHDVALDNRMELRRDESHHDMW
jgi:hypothetical protein